jgi:hypothetical protein
MITLKLTDRQTAALRELVEVYLADDGPAFECMPDWTPAHAPETLRELRAIVLTATEQPK